MKFLLGFTLSLLAFLLLALSSCQQKSTHEKPNIIVLLVDDAGYADFGFMGSKDLETPNIDLLAQQGMIFTDAHVSATVCAPSRAGILTGKYQQRFGFECNSLTEFSGIDTSETLISEALQNAGYKTAAFGKWHVGDIPEANPENQGFDYTWTFLSGARSYFPNEKEDREGHNKSLRENGKFSTFDGYLTDALAQRAIDFIDRNKQHPFFIYWSPNAVHTPMEATEEDLDRYAGHPRQKLAAMTWALDRAIGDITKKLEEESLLENTLIFFLSDNGGANNNQSSNLPLKGFKGNKYEGGHRVAFFASWPDKIKKKQVFDGLTSSLDIFATAAEISSLPDSLVKALDGVSLLPYFTGERMDDPHEQLFWRKEGMAASRNKKHKMIRVDSLGFRLYDLENNLSETIDLSTSNESKLRFMKNEMENWETELIDPLWVESKEWNEVTWWIHKNLFNNEEVEVSNPSQLKKMKNKRKNP